MCHPKAIGLYSLYSDSHSVSGITQGNFTLRCGTKLRSHVNPELDFQLLRKLITVVLFDAGMLRSHHEQHDGKATSPEIFIGSILILFNQLTICGGHILAKNKTKTPTNFNGCEFGFLIKSES